MADSRRARRPDSTDSLVASSMRELFERFPLPLAVVVDGGDPVIVNQRFATLLGAGALDAPALAAVVAEPERDWQTARVETAGGQRVQMRARAARVSGGVMVVLDEMNGVDTGGLTALHAHIAELERLSATDSLTGAWNRLHLDRTIDSEIARSVRLRQPVSLVLFDIDHFKRVNDDFGHAAGDDVLRELVRMMNANLRTADSVYRWGGEEFVVLAPATGYRAAGRIAEKIRSAVERHAFPIDRALRVSAGVAEHLAAQSPQAWFARVDAALYRAKNRGRNRVEIDRRGSSDAWAAIGQHGVLRLAWDEAYECGEESIDREHHELFELANALIEASGGARSRPSAMKDHLERLVEHVVWHFRHEESLLAERGYSRLEAHAHAHARLVDRARELQAEAEAGLLGFGEVVDFLANDIVARHLFAADRDFFPLFRGEVCD